eukprot:CAMPEP_0194366218 /NCGR_PEP_ID=MMETSP0174-20130528/14250_1 /TAXON_ID=216777 /ORGANISM="Proboscia alata, Strain PI-D3" /LENGTH=72 /DNA_ID=CAMNT_0039141283 /DNA_START=46 /DNA_END=260 /DNA_ORIENTATION=-
MRSWFRGQSVDEFSPHGPSKHGFIRGGERGRWWQFRNEEAEGLEEGFREYRRVFGILEAGGYHPPDFGGRSG